MAYSGAVLDLIARRIGELEEESAEVQEYRDLLAEREKATAHLKTPRKKQGRKKRRGKREVSPEEKAVADILATTLSGPDDFVLRAHIRSHLAERNVDMSEATLDRILSRFVDERCLRKVKRGTFAQGKKWPQAKEGSS